VLEEAGRSREFELHSDKSLQIFERRASGAPGWDTSSRQLRTNAREAVRSARRQLWRTSEGWDLG